MKFRKGIFLKCFFKKTYYFLISSPCKASTYAKKRSYIQLVGVGACFCWFVFSVFILYWRIAFLGLDYFDILIDFTSLLRELLQKQEVGQGLEIDTLER